MTRKKQTHRHEELISGEQREREGARVVWGQGLKGYELLGTSKLQGYTVQYGI